MNTQTSKTKATRAPVRVLAQTPATVRAGAEAEKQRKAESKAALKAARGAAKAAKEQVTPEPALHDAHAHAYHAHAYHAAKMADRHAAEALAYRQALEVDAKALGHETPEAIAAYVAEQLAPVDEPKAKTPYNGPMIALKTARLAYTKAKNGIQCNGDKLATLCGAHSREETVAALVLALGLPGNPYLKLNPGQQSMNLRNKARHAVSNGTLSFAQIEAAYAKVTK